MLSKRRQYTQVLLAFIITLSSGCIHKEVAEKSGERKPNSETSWFNSTGKYVPNSPWDFQPHGIIESARFDGSGRYMPAMADLIGANGQPGGDLGGQDLWRKMGLRYSRVEVNPTEGADLQDMVNRGWINDVARIDQIVKENNIAGINTLLLLAYTPKYNAVIQGESKSAPIDINAWQGFVNAVVDRYTKPPFNVVHYQIWNEAAGEISSAKQTPFWRGPPDGNGRYAYAREDYVSKIHIPAAIIIRRYGAYVVYGGWPCESSPATYLDWLEYRSPEHGYNNMLDWIDFLDMHYYNVADLKGIYEKWGKYASERPGGGIKGIWQTEVGDAYMNDTNYIANYFFKFALFALDHDWNNPDKFVSMVYHYWGPQGYHLTYDNGKMHNSGMSLYTLIKNTKGWLSKFDKPITYGEGASGLAIQAGFNTVIQLIANNGSRTVTINNFPQPRGYTVYYKDAISDEDLSSRVIGKKWEGSTLQLTIDVPMGGPDLMGVYREKMGYIVIVPTL
jgi:hypothetical protein